MMTNVRKLFVLLGCLWIASSTARCHAQQWVFWKAYNEVFIDKQGRVIDPQGGDRTTSEGQAYAMFFSLVANDRATFELLLHWSEANLAAGSLEQRLPGWLWGKASDGQWHILDANPASDADLWMSYSLLEAGRLWKEPRYSELGKKLLTKIASEEVADLPGFGTMLLPGPSGFHPDEQTWCINPSYVPLPIIIRLGQFDSQGPWRKIAAAVPKLLEQSARQGFAMDWVSYKIDEGFMPTALPGTKGLGQGSYDAIRVYLWAGMADREMPARGTVLKAVSGMADYLKRNSQPPERVDAQGKPQNMPGPVGFSAALLPYLDALGNKASLEQQKSRVESQRNSMTKLLGEQRTYYDQNLALFAMGWMERRFRFGSNGELIVSWKKE